MACQGTGNELEARFLRALEATTASRIVGNTLELRDASGALRMQLKAGEGN
jgi:heat shock protein HslJ